jgi:hypothetical protein
MSFAIVVLAGAIVTVLLVVGYLVRMGKTRMSRRKERGGLIAYHLVDTAEDTEFALHENDGL